MRKVVKVNFYPSVENCGLARDMLDELGPTSRMPQLLEDLEVSKRIKSDVVPIPIPSYRINYFKENHLDYWLSGHKDMRTVQTILGEPVQGPILDFGGSTGRVIRHWRYETADDLYLCDINGRFINWANRYLAPNVTAFRNDRIPSLPLPDSSFSLIYAFSVFTHIDEFELGWLLELHRVLRPGGKLLATIHNERTWELLPSLKFRISTEVLPGSPGYNEYMESSGGTAPDRAVFVYNGELTNLFFSNRYVRNHWGRIFRIDRIVDEAHNYQSMVVMTKT